MCSVQFTVPLCSQCTAHAEHTPKEGGHMSHDCTYEVYEAVALSSGQRVRANLYGFSFIAPFGERWSLERLELGDYGVRLPYGFIYL